MLTERLTPGQNVVIRDEEWLIKSIDPDRVGEGKLLTCEGVSQLVQGIEGKFHTDIDTNVELLDPSQTQLKTDTSSQFLDSRLFIESHLRHNVINDDKIRVGHRAAMRREDFQLLPAQEALKQPRQRILIADAVGLGKTLEAGILVSELIARGRGRRILVVAVKSMLVQFQKEFWARFAIPLTRLDSVAIGRIQSDIPANHNPFLHYEKSIISIDTLKGKDRYRRYLETAYWDIIVIDEAHNVAKRGGGQSQRSELAELLAGRSDSLIMLSATPHDGKANSFASLMNMLDPTAIPNTEEFTKEDFSSKRLVVRRFKKDLRKQTGQRMQEADYFNVPCQASPAEEAIFSKIAELRDIQDTLQQLGIEKGFLSSPAACAESVRKRLQLISNRSSPLSQQDILEQSALEAIRDLLDSLDVNEFTKYQRLVRELKTEGSELYWSMGQKDRLVIFTERIATKNFLVEQLREDLGLRADEVATASGELADVDLQQIVDDFGNESKPLKLLVCSDVASEGINLHFLSHRLIHFDLPWSLMTFTQRNGRIDRYGQEEKPLIAQLVTHTENEKIAGDIRILELLQKKSQQAEKNIGDPALLMGKHDADEEEKVVERIVLTGSSEQALDRATTEAKPEAESLLEMFLTKGQVQPEQEGIVEARSIFNSDYDYCVEAIGRVRREIDDFWIDVSKDQQTFQLEAPDELKYRYRRLPVEVQPSDERSRLTFTANLDHMDKAIRVGMAGGESTWPTAQYLWRLSPIMEWLNDRMRVLFHRNEAPLIVLPKSTMDPDHHTFIISGSFPNRKSQPVLFELAAVEFKGAQSKVLKPDELPQWRELRDGRLISTDSAKLFEGDIQEYVEAAVRLAGRYFEEQAKTHRNNLTEKLDGQVDELAELEMRQKEEIERHYQSSNQPEQIKAAKKRVDLANIDQVFKDFVSWVDDSMTLAEKPALRVLAVLSGGVSS